MFIGADPYCKVTCEGKSVVTPVRQSTLDPQFDNDMVFYVKKPEDTEIKVQVSCFKSVIYYTSICMPKYM